MIISDNTPLPLSKYINTVLGYAASDGTSQSFPHTQGQIIITPTTMMVTESLNSETFVVGFLLTVQVEVDSVSDSTAETNTLASIDAASLNVNITTDGVELSLDKTKSAITALGA